MMIVDGCGREKLQTWIRRSRLFWIKKRFSYQTTTETTIRYPLFGTWCWCHQTEQWDQVQKCITNGKLKWNWKTMKDWSEIPNSINHLPSWSWLDAFRNLNKNRMKIFSNGEQIYTIIIWPHSWLEGRVSIKISRNLSTKKKIVVFLSLKSSTKISISNENFIVYFFIKI